MSELLHLNKHFCAVYPPYVEEHLLLFRIKSYNISRPDLQKHNLLHPFSRLPTSAPVQSKVDNEQFLIFD